MTRSCGLLENRTTRTTSLHILVKVYPSYFTVKCDSQVGHQRDQPVKNRAQRVPDERKIPKPRVNVLDKEVILLVVRLRRKDRRKLAGAIAC